MIFTLEGMFSIELSMNSIKKFSINSSQLNFSKLVSSMYPFSVVQSLKDDDSQPSTSSGLSSIPVSKEKNRFDLIINNLLGNDVIVNGSDEEDNDEIMRRVAHISRLEHEVEMLKNSKKDLEYELQNIKLNIITNTVDQTDKKLELDSLKNRIEILNYHFNKAFENCRQQKELLENLRCEHLKVSMDIASDTVKLDIIKENIIQIQKQHDELQNKHEDLKKENMRLKMENFDLQIKNDILKHRVIDVVDHNNDYEIPNKKIKL